MFIDLDAANGMNPGTWRMTQYGCQCVFKQTYYFFVDRVLNCNTYMDTLQVKGKSVFYTY